MALAAIEVKNATKRFGGVTAVDHCSLSVAEGSITGLIGPNGAGKSTLFDIVAGTISADEGSVILEGEDISDLPPHQRFDRGLLRTFQIAHEFSQLTTLENLMMVPPRQAGETLWRNWLRPSEVAASEASVRRRAEEVIDFLQLHEVRDEQAANLSGGQRKLLELGRTMMVDAKVVLLDEVAAGINRTLLNDLAKNIERMNRELGYTFFVIEHDMDLITRLCDPVIVMASGSVIAEGAMADLRDDPHIIEAYFGAPAEPAA